jgi:GH35 family endo-1,4-beta-xylanase
MSKIGIVLAVAALNILSLSCVAIHADDAASPFGVCVDSDECKDGNIARLISEAGIKWVRQTIRWDFAEPKEDEFHFEGLDRAIDNQLKNGLNVYGLFVCKSWSDPTGGDSGAIQNWVNFVSVVIERYKDRIKYWEVWNEEDFEGFWKPTSPENYVKLLKATYLAAKKADPGCKIILGGLMGWGGTQTYFPFLDDVYKKGGRDYFDIVAFHPYTMPQDPQKDNLLKRKIEDILERLKNNNDTSKPIWITELGWPSNKNLDPVSERAVTPGEQAEYLAKAFKICLSYPQIKKVFWYGFRDVGTDYFESEHHFGLVDHDLKPKPSYDTYRDFIRRWKKPGQ